MGVKPCRRRSAASALAIGFVVGWLTPPGRTPGVSPAVRAQEFSERSFTVTARKYGFSPATIEVNQDDLVRVTFSTEDIPHSFTVDAYRIAKRVEPGRHVVFEFRAERAGRFPIYCNLAIDERCNEMKGELVVKGR
jgi:heme/copper-type cytochrome/quinol oxidase subunit 2